MSTQERAPKRAKLLDDASSESGTDESSDSGLQTNGLKINEEYAKRFEHNKKREERQQLEEKYGKNGKVRHPNDEEEDDDDEEDSSENESEDDDAEFATEDVDHEIMATLNAIRSKDPRVYDKSVKFYKNLDTAEDGTTKAAQEKPMYLQDYHRRNLMSGGQVDEEEDELPHIQTYQDEQDQLRRELVGSMHATAAGEQEDNASDTEDGDFLVAKSKPKHEDVPKHNTVQISEQDVVDAEKDPETYLSNFMAARAWLPTEGSKWQAFDSDDSTDEDKADAFEEAYNMRFEDPTKANETLRSFARDVGKYSARRDEKSSRKRARERENEKKEIDKRERGDERARLRKLKIEEAEEKLQKIKEAAGMRGKNANIEDWRAVIEGDFDDETWEAEMERRFGDEYYADEDDAAPNGEVGGDADGAKRRIKKPRWDDDIDINDIVPEFDNEDGKQAFTLSDDEDMLETGGAPASFASDGEEDSKEKKSKSKKERMQEKANAKRAARLERRQLEEMVDSALPLDHPSLAPISATSNASVTGFRYRETSPTNFGLSARDILFADDAQLNQYAGLKKLATFREADKKRKDKKNFSKKARLRQWRKETFGDAEAPTGGFERLLGRQGSQHTNGHHESRGTNVDMIDGVRKKKKRSRKGKQATSTV